MLTSIRIRLLAHCQIYLCLAHCLQDNKKRLELLLSLTKIPLKQLADLQRESHASSTVPDASTLQQLVADLSLLRCNCYIRLLHRDAVLLLLSQPSDVLHSL